MTTNIIIALLGVLSGGSFAFIVFRLWTLKHVQIEVEADAPDEVVHSWFFSYCQFMELDPEDCAMVRYPGKNGCSIYKIMPIWEADKLIV